MRNLEFDINAIEDLQWWIENDRKKAIKILKMVIEIQKTPFTGTGKPEPLKNEFHGLWSRRIDKVNRLLYRVKEEKIKIEACRFHYDNDK